MWSGTEPDLRVLHGVCVSDKTKGPARAPEDLPASKGDAMIWFVLGFLIGFLACGFLVVDMLKRRGLMVENNILDLSIKEQETEGTLGLSGELKVDKK